MLFIIIYKKISAVLIFEFKIILWFLIYRVENVFKMYEIQNIILKCIKPLKYALKIAQNSKICSKNPKMPQYAKMFKTANWERGITEPADFWGRPEPAGSTRG